MMIGGGGTGRLSSGLGLALAAAAGLDGDGDGGGEEGEEGEGEEMDDGDDGGLGSGSAGDGAEVEVGEVRRRMTGEGLGGGVQPTSSLGTVGRRLTRNRSDGALAAAGEECLSPLHMLGEAAASEMGVDMVSEGRDRVYYRLLVGRVCTSVRIRTQQVSCRRTQAPSSPHGARRVTERPSPDPKPCLVLFPTAPQGQQGPPSKRKRPADITVPERTGGLGSVEGLGGGGASGAAITPKSPYEDSLAALHEIATSPSTFELSSMREQQPLLPPRMSSGGGGGGLGGGAGGAGKGRARPRLHVDVPGQEPLGGGMGAGLGAASTPGVLLNDNPLLQVGRGAGRVWRGGALERWCVGRDCVPRYAAPQATDPWVNLLRPPKAFRTSSH